jgi:hypothetical protein
MSGVATPKIEDYFPHMQPNGINDRTVKFSMERLTTTNVDARHNTLTAAQIAGGLVVHTSVTGGGNVTMDSAPNIIAECSLREDGDAVKVYYINDGDQTLTLVADTGATVTLGDAAQTIAQNESAILLFIRTGAATVTCYIIGA